MQSRAALFLGMQQGATVFHGVSEAKVTTNCYHWPFLREVRRGKCLIIIWLPPRDSNPDMLIQSQPKSDSKFPGFCLRNQLLT